MSKQTIRRRLLNQRQQLGLSTCVLQSVAAQDHVLTSKVYANAATLALYAPIRNEVQTDRIFAAANIAGKRICYPRLENGLIVFVDVSVLDDLEPGRFGVPEPKGDSIVAPKKLDLILIPGVAFDSQGHRLGYGLGCYDRVLIDCKNADLVGLAYAFQVVPRLPEEEHDIRLDYLATECEMFEFIHKQ